MNSYRQLKQQLNGETKAWLVTGVAGFIGSNLLEALLKLDQRVTGLDNFSTGRPENLDEVEQSVSSEQWKRFTLLEADICDKEACQKACAGVDRVLHHAALGSVPRSIENPLLSHDAELQGCLRLQNSRLASCIPRLRTSGFCCGGIRWLPKPAAASSVSARTSHYGKTFSRRCD